MASLKGLMGRGPLPNHLVDGKDEPGGWPRDATLGITDRDMGLLDSLVYTPNPNIKPPM